jgi:predicted nucleic acid-binding protein
MDTPRFMVDSNVLIDTLNRKINLLAFLDTLLEGETCINPAVWAETLAKPGMTEGRDAEAGPSCHGSSGCLFPSSAL